MPSKGPFNETMMLHFAIAGVNSDCVNDVMVASEKWTSYVDTLK